MAVYSTYSYLPAVSYRNTLQFIKKQKIKKNLCIMNELLQMGRDGGLSLQESSFLISMIGEGSQLSCST